MPTDSRDISQPQPTPIRKSLRVFKITNILTYLQARSQNGDALKRYPWYAYVLLLLLLPALVNLVNKPQLTRINAFLHPPRAHIAIEPLVQSVDNNAQIQITARLPENKQLQLVQYELQFNPQQVQITNILINSDFRQILYQTPSITANQTGRYRAILTNYTGPNSLPVILATIHLIPLQSSISTQIYLPPIEIKILTQDSRALPVTTRPGIIKFK